MAYLLRLWQVKDEGPDGAFCTTSRGAEPQCWLPWTGFPLDRRGTDNIARRRLWAGRTSGWREFSRRRTETQSVNCTALLTLTIVALSGVVLPHGLTRPFDKRGFGV